jgi:alpha-pyrone synthase
LKLHVNALLGLAALRTAHSIALSDPNARILFVCVELCSLHLQRDDDRLDNLVATNIFGDGASAVIVGQGILAEEKSYYEILKASCHARWDLSNTGYKVGLKTDIGNCLDIVAYLQYTSISFGTKYCPIL